MISNNTTTYKLKASKSPPEICDLEKGGSENSEASIVEWDLISSNNRGHGYLRDGRLKNSTTSRGRITEFRPSTSDRKFRSRGTSSKSRDTSDQYRKFNDFSTRNSEFGASKFFELDNKKNELKLNLPEDTRISKLLRRLSIETDQDNSLTISKKLLEVLLLPDNAAYVRKAFFILSESMYEILQVSPGPLAKKQAAKALGRMGYIMAQQNDFEKYQNWLFGKTASSYDDLQILLFESLKETLNFEKDSPILQEHVNELLRNLVSLIETTENAAVFKIILDVLMSVVEIYPENFFPLFRDTIDLLFGWHVDHTQSLNTIEFISKNLQRIPKHFQFYIEFSVALIENFMEDIINYSQQLKDTNEGNYLEHITVLVLAMNTVLRCLGTSIHPDENKSIKSDFINHLIGEVIKTTSNALESFIPENLTIAINDCIGILITFIETKPQTLANTIYNLIDLEITLISEFSEPTIVSLLVFMSKILKELSANLPVEMIEKLIGPKSELVKLRNSPFTNIQSAVISVYQALLNLKNVSLVQEAYRYTLGDFEVVYKKILPTFQSFISNNPFELVEFNEDAEHTAIFLLRCLSQLANASSIIVMWALKPSILELLGVHLKPYDVFLTQNAPHLQYSLIYLLCSHCRCYNHYISTSSLIARNEENLSRFSVDSKDDLPHSSPNSGNFAIILDVIYETLNTETCSDVVILLLNWIKDILTKSEIYLINIYNKESFIRITEILVRVGYNFNEKIVLNVCENLEKLLNNKHLPWSNSFLMNVCDLCKLHMSSNSSEVMSSYTKLAALIPWDVALVEFNKNSINNVKHSDYNSYMITMAQYLHSTGTIYNNDLSNLQFKKMMEFLLGETPDELDCLQKIFAASLVLDGNSQMNMELFHDLGVNSKNLLYNWATLEAAQFCVNSKLRTPLGKPVETFTKIEFALNALGNQLLRENEKPRDSTKLRVKLLLKFFEHLEKRIYNAAEGCAVAMVPTSKIVRSFFLHNANTCNEWTTRTRMVVMHIALHAAEFNTVVRNGFAFFKELTSTEKITTVEFEKCAIFVTLALLNQRETEAIYGLYVWCKSVNPTRKYTWIKYASEQSAKKYEIAIEGYTKILTELLEHDEQDETKKSNGEITNFIKDQIEVCLNEFHNYGNLVKWHDENKENHWKNSYFSYDWDVFNDLSKLETDCGYEMLTLSSWEFEQPKSWSCFSTLSTTENNLHKIALKLSLNSYENLTEKLDFNLDSIENSIRDYLNVTPSEIFQNFSLLQYVVHGLKNVYKNQPANTVFLVSENFETEIDIIDSSILRKILWWSEYFSKLQNQGFNTFTSNLRLDIIKRARKEKNYELAFTHIFKFLKDKDMLVEHTERNNLATVLINKLPEVTMWTLDCSRAITEIIKLLYITEGSKQDVFNLCATSSTSISKCAELFGGLELRKVSSKILLKLSTWMQNNNFVQDMESPLGKLLLVLPDIALIDNNPSGIIPLNEMAIGKLLQFSVHQCVNHAKGWSFFGTWCYKWGSKIVNEGPNLNLNDEDHVLIAKFLHEHTNEELHQVIEILSQNRNISDEEDLDCNSIKTSTMIKAQLQNVLRNSTENLLENLLTIWTNTQKRIYNYYILSAEAYFKYLHLVASSETETEYGTITITLRLLRLIVRYALELKGTLEEGLKTTPTQPWKVIIPQLFSRLNHPESYVNSCVSDLLCRVAEDAPHLITFPAVVGALEGGVKFNFSEITLTKDCLSQIENETDDLNNEDDENDDLTDVEEVTSSLQSSFKTMVDTLSKQDPETITQVQLLVKELRRITLLWDELWLGTLLQHHSEINKRERQLEYEIEKVQDNPHLDNDEKLSLIVEKHRIIMKPIVFILEQLREVSSVEAETPYEKTFQEKFSSEIDAVIIKLKQPDTPEKPSESLLPLKLLQKKFQQKIHKRSTYSLKMQDISPILANIRDTMIAMPGLTTISKNPVKISHVSNNVSILPTKTKPKKLMFYGSDGQSYTYLFKGLEDLHLDERIMQFLNIANTMMAQNADLTTGQNLYRARHYSVIPLGPRSGLINWVDGTTPVFSLYKRWQQREIAKPNTKNAVNTNTTVLRPSELFYNKLNPLLVEHGVKNIDNRKEWPLSVLKQVLTELMNETPGDLLAKELWCNSISANDWWNVTKRYSYSVAVMSIIGYIIGLGDRHLDNVLVDLSTGEVVHIDYNVCFEKGKTLRVPEKVPFRLTQNIRNALGVTGVEGIFRLACENVLKTMRKCRETLLTLLEAFVYDPLIDWTVGGEVLTGSTFGNIPSINNIKQSRKELEKEITISMFNVRCTEIRIEWYENRDDIVTIIGQLKEKLEEWLMIEKITSEDEDALQDLHQQLALVKEAEARGSNKHALYALPARFESYYKTKDALKNAKLNMQALVNDCDNQLQSYKEALSKIDGEEMISCLIELKNASTENSMNVFDLVREFLHNAGKDEMVNQCNVSENEISQLIHHQNASIQKCLQLLTEYKTLIGQCPRTYQGTHRISMYLKWSSYLIENQNVMACDLIFENLQEYLDSNSLSENTVNFMLGLDAFYKETATQINKLYDELAVNSSDIQTLDKLYGTARAGISTFLSCEKNAYQAFEFVITSELLMLNRNFLTLETAAHRSGEWLIKLTSRDGDWFLDDLVLNSTRAVELINSLPLCPNEEHILFCQIFNSVRMCNNIYKGLQELYYNFHTIILPESMKKLQSEDSSLLQVIFDLNELITSTGITIPNMVNQLGKILPCLLMQMEINTSHNFVLERVAQLREGFIALISEQNEVMSPGRMLLMGFNGLFEKLTMEWNNLRNKLGTINVPNSWKKIDQVKDARNISPHYSNAKIHSILDDILLLKKIQAMSDFFNLTCEMCNSFKGKSSVVYTDEQLVKPVRQFIADFISKQLLGVTTEHIAYIVCYLLQDLGFDVVEEIEQKDIGAESKVPLDDLYQKAGNIFLKQGLFSQNALSQASTLESNLIHAWIKIQETKKIQQKITLLQSTQLRLHSQITILNFMREDILMPFNLCTPVKTKFMYDLRNEFNNLLKIREKLNESVEKQTGLIGSVHQRLNWAKGANPEVAEISTAFENCVKIRDDQLDTLGNVSTKIVRIIEAISRHELLRNNSVEAENFDKTFLNHCEKWQIACQYSCIKRDMLTPIEENIMALLTKDLINDPNWLDKISEKLTKLISERQDELIEKKGSLYIVVDAILTKLDVLRNNYDTHSRLISDVKNLIKSMAKIENYSSSTQQFIASYRSYLDNFAPIFQKLKKEIKRDDAIELIENLKYIDENTVKIYDDLLALEMSQKNELLTGHDGLNSKNNPQKQENVTMKGQQRNAYAVNVWRRVKMKLEGRDPDPSRKYIVQEQVDYVIREATSLDNLALLYEGWTPWV